jgi:hypothetical protein
MNDVASAFYAPPITFDEPENEQIEIVMWTEDFISLAAAVGLQPSVTC